MATGLRSYQIFASMDPEHARAVMRLLAEKAPEIFAQALAAASVALRVRPVYLRKQPFEKRADAVRRSLARVASGPVASEILAVYFLDCRKELLMEWLDGVGLAHEDGVLEADEPPQPEAAGVLEAARGFLGVDEDPDRRLLLAAFAAQPAIEWPALEAMLKELPAPQ